MSAIRTSTSKSLENTLVTILEHDYTSHSLFYLTKLIPKNNCNILYYEALNYNLDLLWSKLLSNFRPFYPHIIDKLTNLGFPCDSLEVNNTLKLLMQLVWHKKTFIVINNAQLLFAVNPSLAKFFSSFLETELPNLHVLLIVNNTQQIVQLNEFKANSKIFLIDHLRISAATPPALLSNLNQKEQLFCLALTPVFNFSYSQALYLSKRGSPAKILKKLIKLGMLIFNNYDNSYVFLPNIAKQLRIDFSNLPLAEQTAIYFNLASYYLQVKNYNKAANFFLLANNPTQLLLTLTLASKQSFTTFTANSLEQYFSYLQKFYQIELLYLKLIYARYFFYKSSLNEFSKLINDTETSIKSLTNLKPRRKLLAELLALKIFASFPNINLNKKNLFQLKYLHQPLTIIKNFKNWHWGTAELLSLLSLESANYLAKLGSLVTCFDFYNTFSDNQFSGLTPLLQAEYCYYTNNLDKSLSNAYTALDLANLYANSAYKLAAYHIIAKTAIASGDNSRFALIWTELLNFKATNLNPYYEHPLALIEFSLSSSLSLKARQVDSWITSLETTSHYLLADCKPQLFTQYLSYLIKTAAFKKLIEQYQLNSNLFDNSCSPLLKIYNYIFLAIAYNNCTEFSQSKYFLTQALNIAYETNFTMPFIENYCHLEQLFQNLDLALSNSNYLEFQKKLHSNYLANANKISPPQAPANINSLTIREKEIAYLTASGLSNVDIAKQLFIAEITVKKALQNIFRKLHVQNRLSLALLLNQK